MAEADYTIVPIPAKSKFADLSGMKFGKLTVVGYAGHRPVGKSQEKYPFWISQCECGIFIATRAGALVTGNSATCGKCGRTERLVKHGCSRRSGHSLEYTAWCLMRNRCLNQMNPQYADYGGRGITVCERWLVFENFLADMGHKPSARHTIERENNDGNYDPDNCRWATRDEQAINKRNNRVIVFRGESHCAAEWERILGLPYHMITDRLYKGWSEEEALATRPTNRSRSK